VVNLSWTDSAPSATGTYRVMSLPAGGKQMRWVAGPWLGNVRQATFAAANGASWQFAIEAQTSQTRDSNRVSKTITCASPDTTAPAVPTNVNATAVSCTRIDLSWSAATDTGGSGLKGYNVYRNSGFVTSTTATSMSDLTVAASATYSYTVTAVDIANNESTQSAVDSATTPACADVTAPSIPTNVAASAASCARVNISWSAASDSGSGVRGYNIARNASLWAFVDAPGTTFADLNVSGSTAYSYQVQAVDNAGNVSNL
jgi:fibronectin type 3 domain-containing protein